MYDSSLIRRNRPPIKLIPLIDIILFVLIYFFIAGHLEPQDPNPVDVPIAKNGHMLDQGQIILNITSDGKVHIGEEEVPLAKVQQKVAAVLEEESDTVVTLKADANLDARVMVDVLQAVKRAGGIQVSLVTQQAEATP